MIHFWGWLVAHHKAMQAIMDLADKKGVKFTPTETPFLAMMRRQAAEKKAQEDDKT